MEIWLIVNRSGPYKSWNEPPWRLWRWRRRRCHFLEFPNFREFSKVVRYGFESGPIWPAKWAIMISMDYHIRPLSKTYRTTLEINFWLEFFLFGTSISNKIGFPLCYYATFPHRIVVYYATFSRGIVGLMLPMGPLHCQRADRSEGSAWGPRSAN